MKSFINPAVKFKEEFYDYTPEFFREYVKKNSQNDFVHVEYKWQDLGRDEDWYINACRNLNNDKLKIKREIDLEWTFSSDNSVFSEAELDAISALVKEPIMDLRVNNHYEIQFYENPDFSKNYIISCDVAAGTSNDFSAFTISDPEDFRVIGDFQSSGIDTHDYRLLLTSLMKMYFKNAILVMENNSIGKPILDSMSRDVELEARMFYTVPTKEASRKIKQGTLVRSNTMEKKYGVTTGKANRPVYFELLRRIVTEHPEAIATPKLFDNIKTLIYDKNGRVDHMPGKHDDCLMSYLVFRWALAYAPGAALTKKFGISKIPMASNASSGPNGGYGAQVRTSVGNILDVMNNANTDYSSDRFFESLNAQTMGTGPAPIFEDEDGNLSDLDRSLQKRNQNSSGQAGSDAAKTRSFVNSILKMNRD